MAQTFQTLKGFRDFYPEDCAARNYVFDTWRRVASRYGFQEYEAPILEPTDLYRKKSGDEIAGQLFCFEDKGKRDVSMRPELTPSLARMAAARQRDYKKPLKWFSIGQFFRYEKHQKGRGREFYQFNCDILGEESVAADAELIALSIDLMRELGFTPDDFSIRLSDREVWTEFIKLHSNKNTQQFHSDPQLESQHTQSLLTVIDKWDKLPVDKRQEQLEPLGYSVDAIEDFMKRGSDSPQGSFLSGILDDLAARGLAEYVELDFSIVRGLAYYTGAVFEVFDVGKGMRAVAGGGRYDQLVKLIGNVDMPACGFAMGDMVITDLIRETEHTNAKMEAAVGEASAIDVYVVVADEDKRADALGVVQQLRNAGFRTGLPLSPAKVGKQFQSAEQSGAKHAVIVGAEFPTVSLKNLAAREEKSCDVGEIVEKLSAAQEI